MPQNGAEFNNLIQGNVIACEQPSHLSIRGNCALQDGVTSHYDADFGEQSAIYGLSANAADIVGNRIFGNDNAHFWNQNGKTTGQDRALGKVAAKATQGARFDYNVIHDVFGFSWYANLHAPMKLAIDADGYVTDWHKACMFDTRTGEDNSGTFAANSNVEYHSDFGFGGYMALQISMRNYTSIQSLKALYLKTQYRSNGTAPYVENAYFKNTNSNLGPELGGGHALVELSHVVFEHARIKINHHCRLPGQQTGGLCSSCYWIHDSAGTYATSLSIFDETVDHQTSAIVEWDDISSTLFLNQGSPTFNLTSECSTRPEASGDTWQVCPQSWKIRPLLIYSADRGAITVHDTAAGHSGVPTSVPYSIHPLPSGSQLADYCDAGRQSPNGYTMLVRDGAQLTITIDGASDSSWSDLFVVEYSQPTWPDEKKSSITLTVQGTGAVADGIDGGPFTISSDHSRSWVGPFGGFISGSGAWWHAKNAAGQTATWEALPTFKTLAQFEADRVTKIASITGVTG